MSEVRLFKGASPPLDSTPGTVWTEVQPGSGNWAELPTSFVSTNASLVDEPVSEWEAAFLEAEEMKKKLPRWVYPGIPLALIGYRVLRWILGKKKR